MGLDYVELILALEDEFQISISDEEASEVVTVGDLHALVRSKLAGPDTKRCLTSASFYRVRRGLVEALGVDRRSVRPVTPLDPMMPLAHRRILWRQFQEHTKLKLPHLRRSNGVTVSLMVSGLALTVLPGLRANIDKPWLMLLTILGLAIGWLLTRTTPMLVLEFPYRAQTVGDLARGAVATNYARLVEELGGASAHETWDRFSRVFIQQTGLSQDDLSLEARIVDDLGID